MTTCKCPHCGGEINPASLLASKPRGPRSPAAAEQSRRAAKSPRKKKNPAPSE